MKLQSLNEIVNNYLTAGKTDYAILINGEWGSGKTFYCKEMLMPFISQIEYGKDEKGKIHHFNSTYISLYGLTGVEELSNKILLQLNPGLKKMVSIGSDLLKGYLEKKTGIKLDKELKGLVSLYNIPKSRVLIFDDLERLESKTLQEMLGFINTYTEHDQLKVIIIANEAELVSKFQGAKISYEKVKEKLIRFTYQFNPTLKDVFSDLAKSHDSTKYRSYLAENSGFICDNLEKGNHSNLRTLKFILDIYLHIFDAVRKEDSINEEFREEILIKFLFSLCIYAIEYKKNQDKTHLDLLQRVSGDNQSYILNLFAKQAFSTVGKDDDVAKSTEEIYIESIQHSYLEKTEVQYVYYSWIDPLVRSGIFSKDMAIEDAIEIQNELLEKKGDPKNIKLTRLEHILLLEDNEVADSVRDVLSEVDQGSYPLQKYAFIFNIFENVAFIRPDILQIDEGFIQRFKIGIDKAKASSQFNPNMGNFPLHIDKPSPQLKDIEAYANQTNRLLQAEGEREIAKKIIAVLRPFQEVNFGSIILDEGSMKAGFFNFIDPQLFYDSFVVLGTQQKRRFYEIMEKVSSKYRDYNPSFENDIPFFQALETLLRETEEIGISKVYCKWIMTLCLENINKIRMFFTAAQ